MISRRTGYLLVIGGSALFASTGVMSKAAIDGGITPIELAAVRSYGAALLLLLFLLPGVRRLGRADLVPLALFALVGIVLAQGSYYQAISRMDIAVALVIVYTGPLIVAAYQRVFHRERLPLVGYLAMVLAVLGVAATVLGGAGGVGAISVVGILFAAVTAFAFAGQAIIGARQPTSLPPLARTGASMLIAALIWLPLSPPWALPFDLVDAPTYLGGHIDAAIPVGAAIAFSIVFGSVVPYAMLVAGFVRIGAGAGSMAGMTEPIVAPVLAWFILGQALSAIQIAGVAATIACVAIVERQRFRLQRSDEVLVAEL